MTLPFIFFVLIGSISLAAALGVVTSRQPIHAALFLLVHFITLAVFYITLDAQFLAATQVIVYAGGIVILLLFVIMLVGSDAIEIRTAAYRRWTPYVALALGLVLAGSLAYTFMPSFANVAPVGTTDGGSPHAVGMTLFTEYVLPFELAAVLLLVALLGALLLARRPKAQ